MKGFVFLVYGIRTATFERNTAGLEGVGATTVFAVDEAHELRGGITVVVGRPVGVYCSW